MIAAKVEYLVCVVVLRYTCVFSVPLSVLVSRMSRKDSCLLCSSSLVKVMFFVVSLMVCSNCSVLSF